MIALTFLLVGDFSRRGYALRMALASCVALGAVLFSLALQAAARETPALNAVQYVMPIAVMLICAGAIIHSRRSRGPRKRPAQAVPA